MRAASAATGAPLVQGDEVLTIVPGTLPVDELKRRLADTDAAVVRSWVDRIPLCEKRFHQ